MEKYNQIIEYIKKYNQLPKEKIKLTVSNKEEYESLKSLGTWKSNQIQNAKINFITVLEDIDISKLSSSEKEKHEKKLEKYNSDSKKDTEILLKDYSKLNKKDVIQYDKIKLKIDKQKEERYESSEKLRLWNEIKEKYPKLF